MRLPRVMPRQLPAVLALMALVACGRSEPTARDAVRSTALRYLPADTAGVAVVEAKRIEDRAALARWLEDAGRGMAGQPGLAGLRAILGGPLLEKVDRVALALIPGAAAPAPAGWTALFEGRFDEKLVRSLDAESKVVTLIEMAGGPEVAVTVLAPTQIAVGPSAILQRVRAVADRKGDGFEKAPLLALLETVHPTAHAWGAIDYAPLAHMAGAALSPPPGESPGGPARVPGMDLRGVAFEGHLAEDVAFEVVGVAKDGPAAKKLADAARGLLALARMGASQGSDKAWLEFLDGMSVVDGKEEVRLNGRLTMAMLEAVAGRAGGLSGVPGPPPPAAAGPGAATPGSTGPAPAGPPR
jgi:hypothetical protein